MPGGARGAEIANEVLSDNSVDVLGGKVWLPNRWPVQNFRRDAPIFLVNNFDSLAGLVGKLRSLDLDGPVPTVGAPVSGTEGVFVGQDLGSGTTFSDSSNKMFQSAMEQAILRGHPVPGVQTGQQPGGRRHGLRAGRPAARGRSGDDRGVLRGGLRLLRVADLPVGSGGDRL